MGGIYKFIAGKGSPKDAKPPSFLWRSRGYDTFAPLRETLNPFLLHQLPSNLIHGLDLVLKITFEGSTVGIQVLQ